MPLRLSLRRKPLPLKTKCRVMDHLEVLVVPNREGILLRRNLCTRSSCTHKCHLTILSTPFPYTSILSLLPLPDPNPIYPAPCWIITLFLQIIHTLATNPKIQKILGALIPLHQILPQVTKRLCKVIVFIQKRSQCY